MISLHRHSGTYYLYHKFSAAQSSFYDGESVISIDSRFQKSSMEDLVKREVSVLVSICKLDARSNSV